MCWPPLQVSNMSQMATQVQNRQIPVILCMGITPWRSRLIILNLCNSLTFIAVLSVQVEPPYAGRVISCRVSVSYCTWGRSFSDKQNYLLSTQRSAFRSSYKQYSGILVEVIPLCLMYRLSLSLRLVGQEPEPSQATDMSLACCFLGKVLGVGCHYFPLF